MPANEAHFRELFRKYSENRATEEERAELFGLIHASGHEQLFEELMLRELEGTVPQGDYDQPYWDDVFNELMEKAQQPGEKRARPMIWRRMAIAASLLIGISVAVYFVLHRPESSQQVVQNQPHDIQPGRNQATLTLANGQQIVLTKGLSGKLAQQGNTTIQVVAGNAIAYNATTDHISETITYNTLSTTRGQQSPYPLVLADGSKVWLDAASSITFPTAFNGKERLVTVTGEAYFEVAHNTAQPFKVKVKDQVIEDIGTAFNINAYDDEPVLKTTLIEGSVKINSGSNMVILKPGQQAAGSNLRIKAVDTEGVIAWKNNYFLFEGDNLESIMRKISRWYDVDVVYQYDGAKNKGFGGTISRYKSVSSVLKKLEMTGAAHFKLSGKTIIVTQ